MLMCVSSTGGPSPVQEGRVQYRRAESSAGAESPVYQQMCRWPKKGNYPAAQVCRKEGGNNAALSEPFRNMCGPPVSHSWSLLLENVFMRVKHPQEDSWWVFPKELQICHVHPAGSYWAHVADMSIWTCCRQGSAAWNCIILQKQS